MDILNEARGIAAITPGTVFQSDNGDTITLEKILYFPPDPGSYPTAEALEVAIDDWIYEFEAINGTAYITPNNTVRSKALAMSVWKNDDGELVAYGRYYTKINPGLQGVTWPNTQFKNDTGYGITSSRATDQTVDMKPGNVLAGRKIAVRRAPNAIKEGLTMRNLDPEMVVQITSMINNAVKGYEKSTPGAGDNVQMYEQYVGEYAAPLVLANNSKLLTGDLAGVEDALLTPQGLSWSDLRQVQWPSSILEKLIDSYLIAGKYKLGISSKDSKGGASASVDSILTIVQTKKDQMPAKFIIDNADIINALELILSTNSTQGPLELAATYKFINPEDGAQIAERMKDFDLNVGTLTDGNTKILKDSKNFYKPDTGHPNYNLGYHLLAVVARLVAQYLNDLDPTTFFKGVLNYADLVQINAKVKKVGLHDAYFSNFRLVYPATFNGTITVDPNTNYYATDKPKGRLTFKIRR